MRKTLSARIRGERPSESHELEDEHGRDRRRPARRGGAPALHALPRRRPRPGQEEREERQGKKDDVGDLREDEPARREPRRAGKPHRRAPVRSASSDRERRRENEADGLERFRESAGRVRPKRRSDRGPEHGEALPERSGAERLREEPGPGARGRDEEDLQENEQRLRGARAEAVFPGARGEREWRLEKRQAHSIGRHRVAPRPRNRERLPARDAELERLGDRDRRVEHLLLVRDGSEGALLRRAREQDERGDRREPERASPQGCPCHRAACVRSGPFAPPRALRTAATGSVSTAKYSAPSRANPSSATCRRAARSGSK